MRGELRACSSVGWSGSAPTACVLAFSVGRLSWILDLDPNILSHSVVGFRF